ncbi:MAG: oxidoreductase domain protein [Paenibacillus sp.]|nr:oxidoreductase domain protein [Paenibacillus sp.]
MSQQGKQVRFAVVGCGVIAKSHLIGIEQTDTAVLVAVCDANPERAKEYAETYGVRAFTAYTELLASDEVDVVCLCTPSGMHAEQTIQAAQAGKHVVCEKPMAIVLEDARRMIEICEANRVKLTTIFPRRMTPTSLWRFRGIPLSSRISLHSPYSPMAIRPRFVIWLKPL